MMLYSIRSHKIQKFSNTGRIWEDNFRGVTTMRVTILLLAPCRYHRPARKISGVKCSHVERSVSGKEIPRREIFILLLVGIKIVGKPWGLVGISPLMVPHQVKVHPLHPATLISGLPLKSTRKTINNINVKLKATKKRKSRIWKRLKS